MKSVDGRTNALGISNLDGWRPVQNVLASEAIVEQVMGSFFAGEMKPGERLGTEMELANRFGVSRVTVRDAVRDLRARGVLEVVVGAKGGLRVASSNPERYVESLAIQMQLLGVSREEVMEAMQAIEPLATRLAAMRRDEEDLERLATILHEERRAVRNPEQTSLLGFDFHVAVARAARNRVLTAALGSVRAVRHRFFRPEASQARAKHVNAMHRRIFDAIAASDFDLAQAVMTEHLADMTVGRFGGDRKSAATDGGKRPRN